MRPEVEDLGSIAAHTFMPTPGGNVKGGGDPQHLDKFCEWSGGSDVDNPVCGGVPHPDA